MSPIQDYAVPCIILELRQYRVKLPVIRIFTSITKKGSRNFYTYRDNKIITARIKKNMATDPSLELR